MKNDSFSVDVIKRILDVLSNEGNTKRTPLAGKTGLQFNGLIRYLEFLKMLKWVDFSSDSGSLVSITSVGRRFRRLLDREGPEDISEEVLEKLMEEPQGGQGPRTATDGKSLSCLFCGNAIKRHAVTREIEGKMYSFDRSQCATLFLKFRDVYGKEFLV